MYLRSTLNSATHIRAHGWDKTAAAPSRRNRPARCEASARLLPTIGRMGSHEGSLLAGPAGTVPRASLRQEHHAIRWNRANSHGDKLRLASGYLRCHRKAYALGVFQVFGTSTAWGNSSEMATTTPPPPPQASNSNLRPVNLDMSRDRTAVQSS